MWSQLQQIDIGSIIRRFPISAFLSVVTSTCAIRLIAYDGNIWADMAITMNLLIVGYILFLGGIVSSLIREAYNHKFEQISWVVLIILGVLGYLLLPTDYDLFNTQLFRLPFYLIGITAIFHLLIAYLPFLTRGSNGDFWEYNRKLLIRFVESMFFSFVLFVAMLLAMLALDKLFGVDFSDHFIEYLAVCIFGVFQSWYFLSKFPELEYNDVVERPFSAFLIFTQFIMIPITMIYMVILYAYGVKILIDGVLPRGWIGNLSLWFSVIGIFTYLLNYLNTRFSTHVFTRLFKKYFFLILIVPVVLMTISLYRRIGDYGVTEARYIIAIIASWIISMILIYGVMRWQSLKWLPITLSAVIAFGLFSGPLSIFGCTLRSQENQLYHMMSEAGLLSNSVLHSAESHQNIYDQLRYLDRRTDMRFINDWLPEPISLLDESIPQDQSNLELVSKHLNLNPHLTDERDYFNHYHGSNWSLPIDDYGEISSFVLNDYDIAYGLDSLLYLSEGVLHLQTSDTSYQLMMSDSLMSWNRNKADQRQLRHIPIRFDSFIGDLYLNSINGHIDSGQEYYINEIGGILLIKKK